MKRLLALVALTTIGCQAETSTEPIAAGLATSSPNAEGSEQSAAVTQVAFNVEGAPTVEFSVPNMHCEFSCTPAVKKTLAAQPGVKDVKVDLDTKTAVVSIDKEQFNPEAAVAALVDIQFVDTKLVQ
ncbi:heavy-metal-associated domain-containing protein [Adhaeretor mobilis]|uniref:Heavy-metal-associated domain protein n=1 Tax=Adhaeretor mobilis TaxID=1930276 RepID=A0A517MY88_9BACT|nr:heavy-metal-associated domain-containing protein [Adhaeretor mobilis]QDS99855.1 Heavy-metal-associated domain protein [Adhaeretor mobilis]